MNSQMVPSLSTVLIPGPRIGNIAADMVVKRLRGETLTDTRVDTGFAVAARDRYRDWSGAPATLIPPAQFEDCRARRVNVRGTAEPLGQLLGYVRARAKGRR